jgi:lysophospholipase L1-like esterase
VPLRPLAPLVLVLLMLAPTAQAKTHRAPEPPRRSTVAIVGDSIVESGQVPSPDEHGLAAALRVEVARRHVDPGASGFVAAHPTELGPVLEPQAGRGDWRYRGPWQWLSRYPKKRAPVVSLATSPASSASTIARRADTATLLYYAGPTLGSFAFAAGPTTKVLHSHAGRYRLRRRTIRLHHRGNQTVNVHPVSGDLGLVGVFLRRAPRADRRQVEFTSMGISGQTAAGATIPSFAAGLATLRPDVTIILLGTNDGIRFAATGDRHGLTAMRDGLVARGRVARTTGRCVMVPPAHGRFAAPVYAALRDEVRRAARAAHCDVADALSILDHVHGLTVDGIHPTSAGYARIARKLAPEVLALTRR